jgi:hypothetical protein
MKDARPAMETAMFRTNAKASLMPIVAAALIGAAVAVLPLVGAAPALAQAAPGTAKPKIEPQSFTTAADAAKALVDAAKAQDKAALQRILGSDSDDIVNSGDEVADRRAMEQFAQAAAVATNLVEEGDARVVLVIGAQSWPMPIPIVKGAAGWAFDAAAGRDEILNRRIGENELTTIEVMRAYVEAQKQYAEIDREGDGIKKYARRIMSRPGKRDGLYWEVKPGEEPSPLGELVAEAEALGYTHRRRQPGQARRPYFGYFYRLLTKQGPAAPGGRYDYIVNNHMIAGFAMVAYPAQWGSSGIMTFIVSHQGTVHQKNLGARTAEIAAAMTEYNPDPTWEAVKD